MTRRKSEKEEACNHFNVQRRGHGKGAYKRGVCIKRVMLFKSKMQLLFNQNNTEIK